MKKITQLLTAFFICGNMLVFAQNSGKIDLSFTSWYGVDSDVEAVALQPDGKILIGGLFTDKIKRLNPDGSVDNSFQLPATPYSSTTSSARISAICVQPDGKILIGGHFTSLGQSWHPNYTARSFLTRLNADGSLDNSFTPVTIEKISGSNNLIYSIMIYKIVLQPNGKILVVGDFSSCNGSYRNKVFRLNSNGTLDYTFEVNSIIGNKDAYAVVPQPDGNILLGGTFSNNIIGTPMYGGLVRVSDNGTPDSLFNATAKPNVQMGVKAIIVQPDGKILLGGGTNRTCVRLTAGGMADASFTQSTGNGIVEDMILQPDGKILLGGSFSSYIVANRNSITRLRANGTSDPSFNPGKGLQYNSAAGKMSSFAMQPDGKIVVGGRFDSYNDTLRNNIIRINNCASDLHYTDYHTICAGETLTWINGVNYSNNNSTATKIFSNGGVNGCDSVVTLNLTVLQPITAIDKRVICVGETLTWIDGNTYSTANNTAKHTLQSVITGCDSIVTLNLTISQPTGVDVREICAGETLTWIDGNTYSTANNTATHILQSVVTGCDSVVTLNLTINSAVTGVDVRKICTGDTLTWIDGNTYSTVNNTATHTLQSVVTGCDSVVTLNLTINSAVTGTDIQTICAGKTLTWIDGNTYSTANNTATHTLQSIVTGCDSVVTLNLSVININNTVTTSNGTITAETTNNATYQWINCDNGNAHISGQQTSSFTPTANGNYAVKITLDNCTTVSECVEIKGLGTDNIFISSFVIAPNPAHNSVTINNAPHGATLTMTDLTGKIVYTTTLSNSKTIINLEQFVNGIYFVNVGNATQKLEIQR